MKTFLKAEHIIVSREERTILKDCSFSVRGGEFVGIIGPNGAGKSTFLKAMRGIIRKDGGKVSLMGRDMDHLSEKETARLLAFMQQDTHVEFGFTGREVVMAARYPYLKWWQRESEKDRAIAEKYMAFTGTLPLADKLISEVSGGERQRILLAKVLAQETPVIFLDEPTASLDLVYQEDIFRRCLSLAEEKGKAVVMVCHDLTMAARYCTRLVMISHGTVAADGLPEEVLTAAHLRRSFGLESVVYTNALSGNLDLYTYEKKPDMSEKGIVLVLGSGREVCALYRLLYTSGYTAAAGILPEDSLAVEVAGQFSIPYLTVKEGEKMGSLIEKSAVILTVNLTEAEAAFYSPLIEKAGKTAVTGRTGERGAGYPFSLEKMEGCIAAQVLHVPFSG